MPVVFDEVEATVEDDPTPSPGGSEEEGGGDSRTPADEEFQFQLRRSVQREARLRAD